MIDKKDELKDAEANLKSQGIQKERNWLLKSELNARGQAKQSKQLSPQKEKINVFVFDISNYFC